MQSLLRYPSQCGSAVIQPLSANRATISFRISNLVETTPPEALPAYAETTGPGERVGTLAEAHLASAEDGHAGERVGTLAVTPIANEVNYVNTRLNSRETSLSEELGALAGNAHITIMHQSGNVIYGDRVSMNVSRPVNPFSR